MEKRVEELEKRNDTLEKNAQETNNRLQLCGDVHEKRIRDIEELFKSQFEKLKKRTDNQKEDYQQLCRRVESCACADNSHRNSFGDKLEVSYRCKFLYIRSSSIQCIDFLNW